MSVRQHLLVTLAVCLAIMLAATWALHIGQRHEITALAANYAEERRQQLADVTDDQTDTLSIFVQDYSLWDDMVAFAGNLDPEWSRYNIAEVMGRFRLDGVWLGGRDGELLHQVLAGAPLAPPSTEMLARFAKLGDWNEEIRGHYRDGDRVVAVRAMPIQPTADLQRKSTPVAWLVAARVWDKETLSAVARRLRADVSLHAPGEPTPAHAENRIVVRHPLDSPLDGSPVAELHAAFRIEALELGESYNRRESLVFILSGLLLFTLFAWSVHRHVLRPLSLIGESLAAHSPRPLDAISPRLPEFARLADLIRRAFRQQSALEHEIAERVRLGRDLHDGVIQNLYATGMGLAHGRRLIVTDPAEASRRLEETRHTLNETMETLRRFIARAEPETSARANFADACVVLFQTLRLGRGGELDLDVAPETDARLDHQTKADLLLITREAVSNALRHGEARHVSIRLGPEPRPSAPGQWSLRVRDDGSGFDPRFLPGHPGRGLVNIRARAVALGGTLHLAPIPAGGVELSVTWTPTAARVP